MKRDNQKVHNHSKKYHKSSGAKHILITPWLLFVLFFLAPLALCPQDSGNKYFKNYSFKEYGHQPQNWDMVQDKDGVLYIANQGGLLVFDGVSWRVAGVPGFDSVRSMAMDATGTIFLGGKNNTGYLAAGPGGRLEYISLLEHFGQKVKNFSNVWQTLATRDGVYFRTTHYLFFWDGTHIDLVDTRYPIIASFVPGGELIVQQKNQGLMRLKGTALTPLPGGDLPGGEKIRMMTPYGGENPGQTLLTGTRSRGFFLYDGKAFTPFPTEVDGYIKEKKLYQGIRLSSGDFAMATLEGGLVIMDPDGRLKYLFNETKGLQDNKVHRVFEDKHGNLWLCLDKGVSKIEYRSPFFLYGETSGLPGSALSVARARGTLYAGTTNGLYVLDTSSQFRPVPGIKSSCWALLPIEDGLLAATTEGLFRAGEKSEALIAGGPCFSLAHSHRFPGWVWCGTSTGLTVLAKENNRWKVTHRFTTPYQNIRHMVEDPQGTLWLCPGAGGVLRANFPDGIQTPEFTPYGTKNGLPAGGIYAATLAGQVGFATSKGMFRLNERTQTFVPGKILGEPFAGGSRPVFRIAEDGNKHIWLHSESINYRALPGPRGIYRIQDQPFRRMFPVQVNGIYPDPNGKDTWFANLDGLCRYDAAERKELSLPFDVLIRKVMINGKLIFDGHGADQGSEDRVPELERREAKNFRFEVAGAFYEAETETRYRYFLDGHDDAWTPWSSEAVKDYTTINPGVYVFRAQARNVYYHLGNEAAFRFRVLPPWYGTPWAYAGYGIGLFLFVFLFVKWRVGKVKREKQRLETIVSERTGEISEKNKQLKQQSEKLKEMDEIKSRFFANISHEFRTPLTLILGPLERMLSSRPDREQRDSLELMQRNAGQLLTCIDQLLDLSRFDSSKMKLQASPQDIVPFLKSIFALFLHKAQQKNIDLQFNSRREAITLYFDNNRMKQVITNLLSNALKFTTAGGTITLSVSTEEEPAPGYAEITLIDTGQGIPKDQLPLIFDRFYQAAGKNNNTGGAGIGLALARENVNLHMGTINVHSWEGKGTEFSIRLPLGRRHLEDDQIVEPPRDAPVEVEPVLRRPGGEADIPAPSPQKGTPEAPAMKVEESGAGEQEKPVLLVVEDNTDARNFICNSFKANYTVLEAVDGNEGMDTAQKVIPDLIISDVMMPGTDGIQLCRSLKQDVRTSHIPIILLTAKASEESRVNGLETRADAYITKPHSEKVLKAQVKNLIDVRRQLQQKIRNAVLFQPDEINISSVDKKFIKEVKGAVVTDLSDPDLNVGKLCKKLTMNRTTLLRKLKALTGETPTEYIRSYRLQRAAQLLRDNFGNVSEVAFEAGFSNLSYFSKCFKEKFHQSPLDYQASKSQPRGKEK